jgi:Flp pilus assembly protein TadD
MPADRNLLFGILALQNDFVSRDQLIDAMNAWTLARHLPLGELLRGRGALGEQEHALLEALVSRQLAKHQGDAARSLAALDPPPSVRSALAAVPDPEVQTSLAGLATPSSAATTDQIKPAGAGGTRYRVLRPHARGGLGEIYVAEDTELHREVALKEIQAERARDPGSRGRFLLEAEVTGRLEHPGIVPVYGLGSYPDGRPFYAMRFIKGDNLGHAIQRFHQSKKGFDTVEFRQVLRRFLDLCNAVAYAHDRGVLHRDLKPGNVMLGEFGETLLVDWGLAKVVGRGEPGGGEAALRLSSGSDVVETAAGSAVGTPAYMSPEQAEGRLEALGPATDVYSLGATLFCLLTGRPPVPDGPVAEALEKVRRGDIPPAEQIRAGVPKALGAACAKAMALKPGDRYPSAQALAQDVERWLADEPVSAYRDPPLARAGRWARKHRALVTGAAAMLLVTLAGLGAGLVVVGGLNRRLEGANAKLDEALTEAERKRSVAVAISEFLRKDLLGQADIRNQPFLGGGAERNPDLTVAELLDRSAKAIGGRFQGQPETEAAIRQTIGAAYYGLGKYGPAQSQMERLVALQEERSGADHPDTWKAKHNLAVLHQARGKYEKAEPLLLDVLPRQERMLGPEHPDTLRTRHSLAMVYQDQGRLDDAEPIYADVLARRERVLGADHLETLTTGNNLANLYNSRGDFAKAEPLYLEVILRCERTLGADHPHTLSGKGNLAAMYQARGKYGKAEPLLLEVLRQNEKKQGPEHPDTLRTRHSLAMVYQDQGRLDDAEPIYADVLARRERVLGADHLETLTTGNNLANLYNSRGDFAKAEPLYLRAIAGAVATLGFAHPSTHAILQNLAELYDSWGKPEKAEPLLTRRLDFLKEKAGADSPATAGAMAELSSNLLKRKKYAEAEKPLRDCLRAREKAQPDLWTTFNTRSQLGEALLGQKKYAEAEPLLAGGHEGLAKRREKIPPQVRSARLKEALGRLAALYDATGRKGDADRCRREIDALDKADKAPAKK